MRRSSVGHAGDQPVDVDRLGIERLLAREGEQAAGQRGGALGALQGHVARPADAWAAGRSPSSGSCAADRVQPAHDHGQQIVEVVRHAAGELAHGLHLLRLAQLLLGLAARLMLGFELHGPRMHRLFEGLGEGAKLGRRAFALGDVGGDADDPAGAALLVVEDQPPGLDPAQLAVARPHNSELAFELGGPRRR